LAYNKVVGYIIKLILMALDGFKKQKLEMVENLVRMGILKSKEMIAAMKKVKRELFMAEEYKKYSYFDEPFPIPPFTGMQTISAPHTYPLFYQPLELKKGDKLLEVGTGSGYGAALAREIVGKEGKVITVETNKDTYEFGKENIKKAGYRDVVVVLGDGSKGYPRFAPYDKICVTASYIKIPKPLLNQLAKSGKLILPLGPKHPSQELVLIEKDEKGRINRKSISDVVYVPLVGKYGYSS
jgi:protein-L-isoaspartate(D-aspartate) O-methyltransferase